jgi:tetratricopeptide (TPR) repeat protein
MKLPIRPEVEQAFLEILGFPEEEQDGFLERNYADDPVLRAEVRSLVRAHRAAGSFLEPRDTPDTFSPLPAAEQPSITPSSIGRYRILSLIGEGGMGVVYEAEQDQPRRTVAVKLMRSGFAKTELLRRFEQEAEALGRLQHPGIAHIYEAGAISTGLGPQPYFAMELIRGTPLVEYVTGRQLSTPQRLELLVKICEAVHHAHQRGIIHRDLKPGNILVDHSGQPKILDFGVARATDYDAVDGRTASGQLVGTLAYMSPEQVTADPLELDTRSDVYALGVILFEVLSGRLPYVISPRLNEAIQTIREEVPPGLGSLEQACRGDIETIVAKALEKNKERRYSSAAELAADIQRCLNCEAILARRPSVTYRAGKFARRHKVLAFAAMTVCAVLISGIVISAREAAIARRAERDALRQRDRATAAEKAATQERDRALCAENRAITAKRQALADRNRAMAEKQRADVASSTKKAINDFLENDLLAQASANTQARRDTRPDPDIKVRTALDRAADHIKGKFETQPLVEASIRETIAEAYKDLGLYAEAQRHITITLSLRQKILGDEHPDTLVALMKMAELHRMLGQYTQAEPLYLKVLDVQRRTLGDRHPQTMTAMHELALLYHARGRYAAAEALYVRVLALKQRVLGEKDPSTLVTMNNLAGVYLAEGKYAEAGPLYMKVLDAQRAALGDEHPDVLSTMNNLAVLYKRQGEFSQAESLSARVLDIKRRVLGPEHPDTLVSINNQATLYQAEGEFPKAEALLASVVEIRRRLLGQEHPSTMRSMNSLAAIYLLQGRRGEAELMFEKVLELRRRILGREHPDTLDTNFSLARLYAGRSDYSRAELTFNDVLSIQRRVLGPEHPDTMSTMNELAWCYLNQRKHAQAEPLFAQVYAVRRRLLGPDHLETTSALAALGIIRICRHQYAEAESLLRDSIDRLERKNPDSWEIFNRQSILGFALAQQGRFSEAETLVTNGYDGLVSRRASIPSDARVVVDQAAGRVVLLYQHWSRPEKALEWQTKLSAQ